MMAGMRFGVLMLAAIGLIYGIVCILASACWRWPWLLAVLLYGTVGLFIVVACGVIGKALGC